MENEITLSYEGFLTEQKLITLFKELQNKNNLFKIYTNFKIEKSRFKGDLVLKTFKNFYLIEFDGYRHFQDANTIYRDKKKDELWKRVYNTDTIRVPYFMQLNYGIFITLFADFLDEINSFENISIQSKYPHGFHDKKALLPASFCPLGIKKFEEYVFYFHKYEGSVWEQFHEDVLFSLYIKEKEYNISEETIFYPGAKKRFKAFYNYLENKIKID